LNQRLEAGVGQEIARKEERPLALMLPQLVENDLPAFGKSVPGKNDGRSPRRRRPADDPALAKFHVNPF
jgi:hypothetical protein